MSHGYSQFGEHLDIDELTGNAPHGYACEVGAWNGVELSTTLHLEQRGWRVLCIEANPLMAGQLTMNRKLVKMVACGKENAAAQQDFHVIESGKPGNYSAISALSPDPNCPPQENAKEIGIFKVPVLTLDYLLKSVEFPRLDVLTIDVEGGEADVLAGFDIAWWSPKVIVLEDWKGGRYRDKMSVHGYHLYRRRNVNEVYCRA